VVDLVRGIQTILSSSRVVFLILGDRDWIERAFESHHHSMSAVDVGPEQTLGARFVEKAIQMSFVLPSLGPQSQRDYVQGVLLAGRKSKSEAPRKMDADAAATVREITRQETEASPGVLPEPEAIAKKAIEEIKRRGQNVPAGDTLLQHVSETQAIEVAATENLVGMPSTSWPSLPEGFPPIPGKSSAS
jgi:hypothetical protein